LSNDFLLLLNSYGSLDLYVKKVPSTFLFMASYSLGITLTISPRLSTYVPVPKASYGTDGYLYGYAYLPSEAY